MQKYWIELDTFGGSLKLTPADDGDYYLASDVDALLRECRAHLAPSPAFLATMDRDALVVKLSLALGKLSAEGNNNG